MIITCNDCAHVTDGQALFHSLQTKLACLHLQGALLMSFLQRPLYLSSLTVLLNLPPSAVCLRQTAPQQTAKQPFAQRQGDPQHGNSTDQLEAVQAAVQGAVSGG